MKVIRKCQPVDAEPYSQGMEDGWKDGRPYIHTDFGIMFVHNGDLIITEADTSKSVCCRERFDRLYQRLEGEE